MPLCGFIVSNNWYLWLSYCTIGESIVVDAEPIRDAAAGHALDI